MKRRDFLKYFSLGVVGPAFTNYFTLRKKSVQYLWPQVVPVPGLIPGVPIWYSSVCRQCDAGCGIDVKIRDGRAKKIEGNPNHPINSGKLCARGQAGVQVLYNPDRLAGPMIRSGNKFKRISWSRAEAILAENIRAVKAEGNGDKTVFLTEPQRGSATKLIRTFMNSLGSDQFYSYEFIDNLPLLKANELAFGVSDVPDYDIGHAKYVLSLGAGFLDNWLSPVKQSLGYGDMRDLERGATGRRGWITHFEPRFSLTAANADEWHPIKPGTEGLMALAIANVIVENKLYDDSVASEAAAWKKTLREFSPKEVSERTGVEEKEIVRIAREYAQAGGLALCGHSATAQVNGTFNAVAVNVLNHLVGNVGKAGGVRFNDNSAYADFIEPGLSYDGITGLAQDMKSGNVKILMIHNVNPVFNLPKGSGFAQAMESVPFRVSFSSFMDETAAKCDLIMPDSTYLESWGDFIPVADNGRRTFGVVQPVVAKVFPTKQLGDTLLSVARTVGGDMTAALPWATNMEFVKSNWMTFYADGRSRGIIPEETFELFWNRVLNDGGWWQSEASFVEPPSRPGPDVMKELEHTEIVSFEEKKKGEGEAEGSATKDFHLYVYPAHGLYDGKGANLPWLQEFPEPMITATWGTWAEINPETAKEMDIIEGDMVKIETGEGAISVPAYIHQAIRPDIIAVPLGQGHTKYGRYASGIGANASEIMTVKRDAASGSLSWSLMPVRVTKTGEHQTIAKSEPSLAGPGLEHGLREVNEEVAKTMTPEEHLEYAKAVGENELEPMQALPTRDLRKGTHFPMIASLQQYRQSVYYKYKYRWGMVIDLDKCTGCEACVVACNAENNIPMEGANEVIRGRIPHWIRIDRYWVGEYPNIMAKTVPILCNHCGNAPCEPVCPVAAPFHTNDGLNAQVYNRCIGTRLCGVNCPYKARIFNWFNHTWDKPLDAQLNPDCSVRWAGIMEKCSFCVQRLRYAKDLAKDDDRMVRDGEVQTACVQTCPSNAMTFGNLLDSDSKVSKLTRSERRFRILEEWNTEPAIVFLKGVKRGVEEEHA